MTTANDDTRPSRPIKRLEKPPITQPPITLHPKRKGAIRDLKLLGWLQLIAAVYFFYYSNLVEGFVALFVAWVLFRAARVFQSEETGRV